MAKRVALLGATGSIGRQALEIIEAHPELELCALAAGRRADDARAIAAAHGVRHLSVGGDPPLDRLVEASEPDVVLNAVVGFAGLPATLAALEAGVDLALANKESLVAAGELAGEGGGSCRSTRSTPRSSSASRGARRRASTRSS
jgi:1-deoxy-D-xylulose-5-phosphate reductoisomerase